jgi:hypothetical protein
VVDLVAMVVVCASVVAANYDVAFEGRTFSTASESLGIEGCGTPSGQCVPIARNDPRGDPGASSWGLEPWAVFEHRELADGQIPLWNPANGAGAPLAANMQSAVFDPLLLAYRLHTSPLVLDLALLVCLVLTALAAYAFARLAGISQIAATVVGIVYGLSGWFFRYSNNWWFRAYLYLPLLLICVEWVLRSRRWWPVAVLALASAAAALVGMPELTFITAVAVGVYAATRLFTGPRVWTRPLTLARLAAAGVLGAALAAPALLPFAEYLPRSVNSHSGVLGTVVPETLSPTELANWLMPKFSGTSITAYAGTANWVGAGAVVLLLAGVTSRDSMRRYLAWPVLALGALAAAQVYGGILVNWTRFIPLWSVTNWSDFSTPVMAFAIAFLAGIGVQALMDRALHRVPFAVALGLLGVLLMLCALVTNRPLPLGHDVAVLGGWPLAACAAALTVTAILLLGSRAAVVVVALVAIELLLLVPRGTHHLRAVPYPARNWIAVLVANTAKDRSRVFSSDGLLFPETATVYGLQDPRLLDALYVERYWRYLKAFVARRLPDRFTGIDSNAAAQVAGNPMFDLLGVRYLVYDVLRASGPPPFADQFRPTWKSERGNIYENTHADPRAFVVHGVRKAAGEDAAFDEMKEGAHRFADGTYDVQFDPMRTAVVEGAAPDLQRVHSCPTADAVPRIVSYEPGRVAIRVSAHCAGLLVLTDSYYPGWKATVNGKRARIHSTDGAFRGVVIPQGASTVVFRYEPASFRDGVVLAVLGSIGVLALAASDLRRRRRRGAKRNTATPDGAQSYRPSQPSALDLGARCTR